MHPQPLCKSTIETEQIWCNSRVPPISQGWGCEKLTHKNEGVNVCHHLNRNTKNCCALRGCVQLIHTDAYQQQCECLPLKPHHKNKTTNPTSKYSTEIADEYPSLEYWKVPRMAAKQTMVEETVTCSRAGRRVQEEGILSPNLQLFKLLSST
jgi:hypothetical protein